MHQVKQEIHLESVRYHLYYFDKETRLKYQLDKNTQHNKQTSNQTIKTK